VTETLTPLSPGNGAPELSSLPSERGPQKQRLTIEELRRAELVEAAVTTIHEKGFDGATVRDIAKAAGASPGSVLYYFRSKDELLAAAFEESDVRFRTMVRESIATEEGLRKVVRLIEICLPEEQVDSPLWSLQIDLWSLARRRADFRSIFEAASADWLEIVEEAIADAVTTGDLPDIIDPRRTAIELAALLDGLAVEERATEHITSSVAREIALSYVQRLTIAGGTPSRSDGSRALGRRRRASS
jgi:AcrR family transcriptional regulator